MKWGLNVFKEYGCAGQGTAWGTRRGLRLEGSVNNLGEEDATSWSARPPSRKHQQEYFSFHAKTSSAYLQQRGLQPACYPKPKISPGPRPTGLPLLPTIVLSSNLFLRPQGIWSCRLQAAGKASHSFPGASRIPDPQQDPPPRVPRRTGSSTCLKLMPGLKAGLLSTLLEIAIPQMRVFPPPTFLFSGNISFFTREIFWKFPFPFNNNQKKFVAH